MSDSDKRERMSNPEKPIRDQRILIFPQCTNFKEIYSLTSSEDSTQNEIIKSSDR